MADKSSIEWLNGGSTYNPIRARRKTGITIPGKGSEPDKGIHSKIGWACVRISPGCEHCYSEKQNVQCGTNPTRHGTGLKYNVPALEQVELFLDEKTLLQPLHWKKGRLIFPCSMTDWMADFVPDEWRDKMLAVMAMTPQHTYLTLTKRAKRQREYFSNLNATLERVLRQMAPIMRKVGRGHVSVPPWPWRNFWHGVSAESQPYADERIPELLQTPAAVRWVSAEPLLGGMNIVRFLGHRTFRCKCGFHDTERELTFMGGDLYCCQICKEKCEILPALNWVVGGFESGPHARPGNPEWGTLLRDQCAAAGTAFFWKQNGEFERFGMCSTAKEGEDIGKEQGRFIAGDYDDEKMRSRWVYKRVGKKAAGRLLDGKEHNEYPEAQP